MIYHRYIVLAFTCALLLTSCSKQTHHPYLRPLPQYLDYYHAQDDIIVRAKSLTRDDCKAFFGPKSSLLFKKRRQRQPIYPIQISVTNRSEHVAEIKPENIDIQLTSYKDVAQRLAHNPFLQAFGGIMATVLITGLIAMVSSFILTPGILTIYLFGAAAAPISAPLVFAGTSALVAAPLFFVIGTPVNSTLKGIKSAQSNSVMKKELQRNSLQNALRIEPYQSIETLIFVSKPHYKNEFKLGVTYTDNETDQKITNFNIRINNPF